MSKFDQMTVAEHVHAAERHAQAAYNRSHTVEPQTIRVRLAIGRAQSILISLLTRDLIREDPDGS